MKNTSVVRNYYILPCCLLLLNICNSIVSYKADMIGDPYLRTAVIILLVLFGSSVVAFAFAPAIEAAVRSLHKSSRRGAGGVGEILFLVMLGLGVFYVYFQLYINGPESILPRELWNSH